MTIRDIYIHSIEFRQEWLAILIEFLVFEKKVLQFEDGCEALDLYFKPNNQARMNQLLLEYKKVVDGSDWVPF